MDPIFYIFVGVALVTFFERYCRCQAPWLTLAALLLSACGKQRDFAAEEAADRARAKTTREKREAAEKEDNDRTADGSAACTKIANDVRQCEALPVAKREGAAVCGAVDVDLFQKCARYKANMER